MGPVDRLRCHIPLPVYGVRECVFQTQSLDNLLDDYTLRSDGTLWRTDRDTPSCVDPAPRLAPPMEVVRRARATEVFCEHVSGPIVFYTDYGRPAPSGRPRGWVEFQGIFRQGRLLALEVLEHAEPPEIAALRLALRLAAAWARAPAGLPIRL